MYKCKICNTEFRGEQCPNCGHLKVEKDAQSINNKKANKLAFLALCFFIVSIVIILNLLFNDIKALSQTDLLIIGIPICISVILSKISLTIGENKFSIIISTIIISIFIIALVILFLFFTFVSCFTASCNMIFENLGSSCGHLG